MPTIAERKFELKQKRSDALMAKINVLRARDGSVAPPIDSMKDEDDFNLALLFGNSRNDSIDWDQMGVEGLIRCYYEIIYRLDGTVRNNIIKAGATSGSPSTSHNTSSRSGLKSAVDWLSDGQGYKSGFYIGWSGLDVEANEEDNATKKQRLNNALSMGRKGDFDVPMTEGWSTLASQLGKPNISSSFTHNRDQYLRYNSAARKLELVYPPNNRGYSLLGKIDNLLGIIGTESQMGPHYKNLNWGQSKPPWENYVNDTLLGMRHRDVAPYDYQGPGREKKYKTVTTTDPETGQESSEEVWTGEYTYQIGFVNYGDGNWDTSSQTPYPPGYTPTPDYWNPAYEAAAQAIIDRINDTIFYIEKTRITIFTYFVNYRIIPGMDPDYDPDDSNSNIGSSWNLQNDWITELEGIRDRVQQSIDYISARKNGSNATQSGERANVDNEVFQLKALLQGWLTSVQAMANEINSENTFGTITNPLTLYGHRFMWIRTLIHASEGTMTAVNSTGIAIEMMNKKLSKSEEELMMFGLLEEDWIPTPIIVGVEPYPILNQATFEMEIGGWLVAWGGQEHCTGYDVWRSIDYDPTTKSGTWTKLEVSNTDYTMSDIDANTGKVLTYIIDTNVDPIPNDVDQSEITHPYYKVRAYDYNGGSGDYGRRNASSEECEPSNPAAFPLGGASTDTSGPRRTPVTTTSVETGDGSAIPPNTLFWVTSFKGVESADFERRIFISEAPFDSIASNLIVFVNGEFKNQGPEEDGGDYELIDTYKIRFHQSVGLEAEVNLVVALRSFANPSQNVKGSVAYFEDLPQPPDVEHGDIYFVENPSPGQYWQYVNPPGKWREVQNPNSSSIWRDAVNTFSQLPSQLNADGDVRLVLDTSTLYRWDGVRQMWVKISGAAGGGWLSPVDTTDDLAEVDTSELSNGVIVFVISEESLFRWSTTQNDWLRIAGSNAANWKDPVNTFSQLPDSGNSEGDIRLVLSENKMYRWFAWEQLWKATKADAEIGHNELTVDDWEVVDDHDVRYYPRDDLDDYHLVVDERLSLLESLKPKNAEPLSGDFGVTGTKLYQGFISEGSPLLRYETLQPTDYFRRIIKDASFILSNQNSQQFKDADKGVLYCYINGEVADEFNLGQWFNEDERTTGQSYPKQFGINNIIEILSVGPYNQYPTYQRADFQLNIKQDLLVQGENKIQLVHEVGNSTNDINTTDEFIVFWDAFDGEMGFKDIYMDEVELNSSKYLSGVRYYSIGDKFRLRFEAENIFNNSYIENEQLYIGLDEFAVQSFHTNYKDEYILGQPQPRIGEDIYYLNEFTIDQGDMYSSKPILKLEAKNPFKTHNQIKSNTNFLINTVSGRATDTEEFFVDEIYRLPLDSYNSTPGNIIGLWDSTQALSTNDLQLFGGKLVFPSEDFSKYHPTQSVDYSNFSGQKQYIRAFRSNQPHNNGVFTIRNFYNADPNIKVEIKLPGLTGWMQLNKLYNMADFTGTDGDGCLVENKGEVYEWTSGGFSTADSGYIIIVRITMYEKTNYISSMKIDW